MKRFFALFLSFMILFSCTVALADEGVPYPFLRTKTVTNLGATAYKTIIEDNNWYDETTVVCTWKSSTGPSHLEVVCEIKENNEWIYYGARGMPTIGSVISFTISGGNPFRLKVIKVITGDGAPDGDCVFSVSLD